MQKEQIIFFNFIISICFSSIFFIHLIENNRIYGQTAENEVIENTLNTVERVIQGNYLNKSLSNDTNSTSLVDSNTIEQKSPISPTTLEEQLELTIEHLKNHPSQSIDFEFTDNYNKSIPFFESYAFSPNTEENIKKLNSSLKQYENEIIGIKLKYPSNWYLENNGYIDPTCMQEICKIVLYPIEHSHDNFEINDDNNSRLVGFIISSGSTNSPNFKEECKCNSFLEFVRSTYVKLFRDIENLSFVNDNQTTIAENISAWQLEFDIKNIDSDWNMQKQGKMWTIWTMNDDAFYHVGYVADKESYSKYLPDAKQVVKSIEFIPIEEGFKKPRHPSFMENLDIEEKQESVENVDEQKETRNNKTMSNQDNKELTAALPSLLEEKEFQLAKEKLKDQTDKRVKDIVITSNTSYTDSIGDMHIVGEVKNNLPNLAESVKIIATLYDSKGNVIGMDYTYTEPSDLESNEKAPFELTLSNSTLPIERISNYNLKVTWRK